MMNFIGGLFISKLEEFVCRKTGENILSDINHTGTVEDLKKNLEALSARASDVEVEIKNTEQSGHKKRKREVENWLQEVKKLGYEIRTFEGEAQSEGFVSRFLGGDRAVQLKERVAELVEQSRHFGELVLEARETRGEELLTTNLVGEAFEENLERIWKFLTIDDVKSIGIYGMGGVGKTTLTKHINNRLLKETQESVFWVTVSHESSIMMLQDKIAHVIRINFSNEYDEDKRAARLYRELSSLRKKFVLILDDVWKNINLKKLGVPLPMEGSRVIITTRSLQLCHQIACQKVIQVKTLDKNEAWELFRDTLGQEVTLTPQIEEIAKRMTKVCDGLPLGIITLAGGMRGETAIHAWRNALEELQESVMEHDDMDDHVFKVLKYSFDRLNPKHHEQGESNGGYTELQFCFLYCSLYPEDHRIEREELVRKLVSEELVDKRKRRGAQVDLAHTILDKLVNVCLLESLFDGSLKMHDLVRAMALKITQGKNMVLAGCLLEQIPNEDEYWTKDVEKISLMFNSIKEIPGEMSPNCPNLSTLLLQENRFLKFIADSFFSQMHGLSVLDLSRNSSITKMPNSLSDLENLKALLLYGCLRLVNVPYLGKMKALKELNLSFTSIREVPQGMDELVNLKFLSIDYTKYLKILPTGLLSKFRNLQCLHLPGHIEASIIEMESLRKLEEFKGRVNDAAEFNQLIGCRALIRYCIIVGSTPGDYYDNYHRYDNYNQVILVGCNYHMEDDEAMLTHDAQHLRVLGCLGLSKSLLDDFPRFNNPKSLNTLEIRNCEGMECILVNKEEIESHCTALLGTIDTIRVCRLPNFMGIIQKQELVFPTRAQVVFSSLRRLFISNCGKMKNLGLIGSEFPNLEQINVESCEEMEEIIEKGRVVSFPRLKWLTLRNLSKLKHVGTTTICDSVKIIQISGCGALKKLPLCCPVIDGGSSNFSYSPPPALQSIYMSKETWESLEWEHPSHKHLLQPFLEF